jgi:N-acetyl sugar amidotransferase
MGTTPNDTAKRNMQYCIKCTYPIVAVNLSVSDEGVCSGCIVHNDKPELNWEEREQKFSDLLNKYKNKDGSNYDCIIPVSGGKDSTFQVWYVKEKLKLNPLLVTYYTHNYTDTGEHNLKNLSRTFSVDHYVFTPGYSVIAKMNRVGFALTGDMSWHFHVGAWTVPFQIAVKFNIPIVIYGEHGTLDLAGQYSFDDYPEFTQRYRKENMMRGFDIEDFIGKEDLQKKDLVWAQFPSDSDIKRVGVRGIFMGNYVRWDAEKHTKEISIPNGFKPNPVPFERTYRTVSNVDDIHENGIKDYLKFVKFGYGRCTDHTSKDIRLGNMTRKEGVELVKKHDPAWPEKSFDHFQDMTGISEEEFRKTADTFRDPRVWWIEDGKWWKDTIWGEAQSYGNVHLPKNEWKKYE